MAGNTDDWEQTLERLSENDRMFEHRLTVLETRWDAILPTLATKADLAEVKSQLKTLFITMLLGFASLMVAMAGMMLSIMNLLRP